MNDIGKYKILILGGERSCIDELAHILKSEYSVSTEQSGQKAIETVKKNEPDLILIDTALQGMSGFDVLSELKASEITSRIPIIITGRDNFEDEDEGFLLGAADYITKPFNHSIVKARVKTHLKIVEYIRTIELLDLFDPVTNIPNRRSFNTRANIEWNRAKRSGTPISGLMIIIDGFKEYNDKYGYPRGDALIYNIAGVLTQSLKRLPDFAARWGDDEFVLLLPDTNLNGALEVAEKIRDNLEQMLINCEDNTATLLTVSIGVNSEIPAINSLLEEFISKVEKAFCTVRGSGKNKVYI